MIKSVFTAAVMLLATFYFGAMPQQAPSNASPTMTAARRSPVQIGEIAPDFTLEDVAGKSVNLSAARGKMPVVLVFYRGYWCPYCAHQLRELRSLLNPIENVRLYAISIDSHAQTKDFAAKLAADGRGAITYSLLSDPKHQTIDAYGLHDAAYDGQEFEGIPHAAVYVIDKQGRVQWMNVATDYRKRPTNHDIHAALDVLQ